MDRRNFLRSLIGGVAVGAAVRSWPFRVFSFPSEPEFISVSVQELHGTISQFKVQLDEIVAIELENFAHEIPTLMRSQSHLYELFKRHQIAPVSTDVPIVGVQIPSTWGISYAQQNDLNNFLGLSRSPYPGKLT